MKLALESSEVADELADAFTQQREELVRPFPGAVETLRALRERGARMALITNGTAQFQRRKIERFGLKPYFELILIEGEFGAGKPDPRPFLHALRCLGAAPSQAWMIGDDLEYDIRPARALGMGAVWVDYAGKGLPQECQVRPEWIVKRIADLLSGETQ
jgi:putative hydrolase of the HAD superfamily